MQRIGRDMGNHPDDRMQPEDITSSLAALWKWADAVVKEIKSEKPKSEVEDDKKLRED